MLWTLALLVLLLWAIGLARTYTRNGYIHILLVIGIVAIVVRVISD